MRSGIMTINLFDKNKFYVVIHRYAKTLANSKSIITEDIFMAFKKLTTLVDREVYPDMLEIICEDKEILRLLYGYLHSISLRHELGICAFAELSSNIDSVNALNGLRRFCTICRVFPSECTGNNIKIYVFKLKPKSVLNPDYGLKFLFSNDKNKT